MVKHFEVQVPHIHSRDITILRRNCWDVKILNSIKLNFSSREEHFLNYLSVSIFLLWNFGARVKSIIVFKNKSRINLPSVSSSKCGITSTPRFITTTNHDEADQMSMTKINGYTYLDMHMQWKHPSLQRHFTLQCTVNAIINSFNVPCYYTHTHFIINSLKCTYR